MSIGESHALSGNFGAVDKGVGVNIVGGELDGGISGVGGVGTPGVNVDGRGVLAMQAGVEVGSRSSENSNEEIEEKGNFSSIEMMHDRQPNEMMHDCQPNRMMHDRQLNEMMHDRQPSDCAKEEEKKAEQVPSHLGAADFYKLALRWIQEATLQRWKWPSTAKVDKEEGGSGWLGR